MSAISNTGSGSVQPNRNPYQNNTKSAKAEEETEKSTNPSGDSVEISAEARQKAEADNDTGSLMQPAKTMTVGSGEYRRFRELMDKVKGLKSSLSSEIRDIVAKSGIDLSGKGAMKLEVDSKGNVLVGGIEDKSTARALEKALNKDRSLGKRIREYQESERELSGQISEYTGCSLYELTSASQGNISQRISGEIEQGGKYEMGADYYMRLGFLGDTQQIFEMDDISGLSFTDGIDFSGEIDVLSNPEGNIKNALQGVASGIEEAFKGLNEELTKALEARGMTKDEEGLAGYLLDLSKVSVRIDNNGGVTVNGMLSDDPDVHRKGVEIIRKFANDMLADPGDNSYHVNLFLAASRSLLNRDGADAGAMVVGEITGGGAGKIHTEYPPTSSTAQAMVRKAQEKAMASVL